MRQRVADSFHGSWIIVRLTSPDYRWEAGGWRGVRRGCAARGVGGRVGRTRRRRGAAIAVGWSSGEVSLTVPVRQAR